MMKQNLTKYLMLFGAGLLLGLSGCQVGPDYQVPIIEMPDQWHQELTQGIDVGAEGPARWWELLNDPMLNGLITDARQNNPNLQSAYWNLLQTRYARDFVTGHYYPSIEAAGSYTRTKYSENGFFGGGFAIDPFDTYSVGFDALWETNLFGRTKRALESAQASYEARIEQYRDVLVSLSAEVARNYVELRTIQARMEYTLANIESQEGMLKLAQTRFEAELAPRLDVEQALLNLADTRSQLPLLESAEKATVNRLCVLVGKDPGQLSDKLTDSQPIPVPPRQITLQLPAELLRRRPDIRMAERELAAQTALIGYTAADLYPSFSLTGNIGFEAMDFSDLAKNGSLMYGVGPVFRWNIFNGNRIRNQIKIEESKTEQLYWQYRSTVLVALEEVENAITDYIQEGRRQQALRESVAAAKKSVELVTTQYKNGLTNFQDVLVLQRSQLQQEDKLAQSEGLILQNLIRIYKALGGWGEDVLPTNESEEEPDMESKPTM